MKKINIKPISIKPPKWMVKMLTKDMNKQVIIIDSLLKMKKGKIARVVAGVTAELILNNKDVTIRDFHKCIVLKTDNYDVIQQKLYLANVHYVNHIDAGLTSVEAYSDCATSFIYKSDMKLDFIDELRLL